MLRHLRALCAAATIVLAAIGTLHTPKARAQAIQVPPAKSCFQATTGINGMLGTLGPIVAGSGGTNGTYANVPLTGGSGTTATANVTVSGGVVTQVIILNPGINYVVGDALSASSGTIGGVTGFSVSVSSISINSSLAGGTVGFYIPSTLSIKQTWQDAGQTTLNSNPVPLDANGCALIYGVGTYRQILQDSLGNTVWDQLTSVPPVTPYWAGLAGGTGNAITVNDTAFTGQDGQSIAFVAAASNTSASVTLNPSGYGNIPVVNAGPGGPTPLATNAIAAGNVVTATYVLAQNDFQISASTFSAKFASSCGVAADGVTDDTAAWNVCVAYANAHPGTTIIASQGTSTISALTAFTASNSYVACINGPGACILSHSGTNALKWSGSISGGGLINMGLNNTGSVCTTTILVNGGAEQLRFDHLVLGTGIDTLATLGAASSPAGLAQWQNITSPGGVANVACPLFSLVNGNGFVLQNSVVFVAGKAVSGRTFVLANITGPSSWDAVQIQGSIIEFFQNVVGGTVDSSGLLLDGKLDGNYFDNCIGPCVDLVASNSSTISAWTINNNWMDNDIGLTDCLDILQGAGNGNIIGMQILHNRVSTCGQSGIVVGGVSATKDNIIDGNFVYNVNVLNSGTTYGILVGGDGADGIFNGLQINENSISAPGWSSIFSPYNNPTYGIGITVSASGGVGAQYVQMQNNVAIGSSANYLLPATIVNSWIEGNIGLPSSAAAVTVGASPFTFSSGAQPETVYIYAGTVSSVAQDTVTICAASPCTVDMRPNESIIVTYSGLPTMKAVLH